MDLVNSELRLTQVRARTKKQTAPRLVTRSSCLGNSAGECETPAADFATSGGGVSGLAGLGFLNSRSNVGRTDFIPASR